MDSYYHYKGVRTPAIDIKIHRINTTILNKPSQFDDDISYSAFEWNWYDSQFCGLSLNTQIIEICTKMVFCVDRIISCFRYFELKTQNMHAKCFVSSPKILYKCTSIHRNWNGRKTCTEKGERGREGGGTWASWNDCDAIRLDFYHTQHWRCVVV